MNKIQLMLIISMTSIALGGCTAYGDLSALPADGLRIVHKDESRILISERVSYVSLSPKLKI